MVFPIVHSSRGLGNTAGAVPSVLCPSAPGLAEFGKDWAVPGTKVRPFSSSPELGAFCIYVFVRVSIATRALLIPTPDRRPGFHSSVQPAMVRRAGSWQRSYCQTRLLRPSSDRLRLGQATPLSPQHCTGHHQPPNDSCACPHCPGLRPPPFQTQYCPFKHLLELDLGLQCPLGLCQSVTRDWADHETHQSTAQVVPDGSFSAFQLPGHFVSYAGPCLEDTSSEMLQLRP